MGSNTAIYTYQFYAIGTDEPVVEPTGDTVILFTNDVHCGIRDGWGYAGVADLKKSLEAAGNEVLLVDAGDHVQGGPIGSLTQGEAIIDIMNEVGYDLATLGNHEFDYGM
ncbi:MAG: metallophosphoesterase, partial [Clostridia bacterium]|nr:metallophosphoesterase [Clostridia bacterium]